MSDLHAWPSAASVDAAFAEFAVHRDRLRTLAHLHGGDDGKPVRAALLAELFALDDLEERMRRKLAGPLHAQVPERREVGEQTGAWLRGETGLMRRNRGPQ